MADLEFVDRRSRVKLLSAIYYKNSIISVAQNELKSHPLQSKHSSKDCLETLHAEVNAIRKALKIIQVDTLRHVNLYVARIRDGDGPIRFDQPEWGLCKPCTTCQNVLDAFDIGNVFYTTNITGEYGIL